MLCFVEVHSQVPKSKNDLGAKLMMGKMWANTGLAKGVQNHLSTAKNWGFCVTPMTNGSIVTSTIKNSYLRPTGFNYQTLNPKMVKTEDNWNYSPGIEMSLRHYLNQDSLGVKGWYLETGLGYMRTPGLWVYEHRAQNRIITTVVTGRIIDHVISVPLRLGVETVIREAKITGAVGLEWFSLSSFLGTQYEPNNQVFRKPSDPKKKSHNYNLMFEVGTHFSEISWLQSLTLAYRQSYWEYKLPFNYPSEKRIFSLNLKFRLL